MAWRQGCTGVPVLSDAADRHTSDPRALVSTPSRGTLHRHDPRCAPATKADAQFLTEQFGLLLGRADSTGRHIGGLETRIDELRDEAQAWRAETVASTVGPIVYFAA